MFDEIVATRGEVDEAFQTMLARPELLRRVAHLGSFIRFESSLPAGVRECVILATGREFRCQFELTSHEPQARAAGVSEATIRSIREGRLPSAGNDGERVAVQFAYESLREHRVTDPTFQRARDLFGIEGATEIAATIGYYTLLATLINVFDVGR